MRRFPPRVYSIISFLKGTDAKGSSNPKSSLQETLVLLLREVVVRRSSCPNRMVTSVFSLPGLPDSEVPDLFSSSGSGLSWLGSPLS